MISCTKYSMLKAVATTLTVAFIPFCSNQVNAVTTNSVNLNNKAAENTRASFQGNARIIGGQSANIQEFPYIGSILSQFASNARICTGSLISETMVLTSADCLIAKDNVTLVPAGNIEVSFGTNINVLETFIPTIRGKNTYLHPDFTVVNDMNSIGIIQLISPVPSDIATPIALYSEKITDTLQLVAAGWGRISTEEPIELSVNLTKISVSPSSSDVCKQGNTSWSDNNGSVICTVVENDKSIYNGDAGGPLTYTHNGSTLLVGVASGLGVPPNSSNIIHGTNGSTNYFTHAYNYIDWIVEVTGLNATYLLDRKPRPTPDYSTMSIPDSDLMFGSSPSLRSSLRPVNLFLKLVTSVLISNIFLF